MGTASLNLRKRADEVVKAIKAQHNSESKGDPEALWVTMETALQGELPYVQKLVRKQLGFR